MGRVGDVVNTLGQYLVGRFGDVATTSDQYLVFGDVANKSVW